jgi:hypothetical protein
MKKIIAYTALILLLGSPIYFGGWVLYNTIPYHIEAYDWFLASIMLLTFVIFFKVGERVVTWAIDTIQKKEDRLMSKEIKISIEEVLELVTFTRNSEGRLRIVNVLGDVGGDVVGNVRGYVIGNVRGDVYGDVVGNVRGDVVGYVGGYVGGSVYGNVRGDVVGSVGGDVVGSVHGDVKGGVGGGVFRRVEEESK